MAVSKCVTCGKMGLWELVQVEPTGSKFKMYFVQCTWCGTPVGVVPFHDPAHVVQALAEKLGRPIQL